MDRESVVVGHTRPCPICDGMHRDTVREIIRGKRKYGIHRCSDCGFRFVGEVFESTFVDVQVAPLRVPVRRRHLNIKALCDRELFPRYSESPRCRIAEIGAGWGGLAEMFRRDPRYDYVGFEPSSSRATFCVQSGLKVRNETFCGRKSVQDIDAIVCDNVLEHVLNPGEIIQMATESLKLNGLLVVIVPNVRDIRQVIPAWRDRHHWQPHCHINYFSKKHLAQLFSRNGFSFHFIGVGLPDRSWKWFELPRVLFDLFGTPLFGLNCFGRYQRKL